MVTWLSQATLPELIIAQQEQCAFFNDFPQEVRDIIYRCLLKQKPMIVEPDRLVELRNTSMVLPVPRPRTSLDATILRTCRRIYKEALPILYSENWFCFDNAAAIKTFSVRGLEHEKCEYPTVMASYRFTDRSHPFSVARRRRRIEFCSQTLCAQSALYDTTPKY